MAESAFPSLQSSGPSSLQMPESLPSLGEREPEFVNPSDVDRFRCHLHKGLLKEPRQTNCGHRFCHRCLEEYLSGTDKKACPVGDPDCEEVVRTEVARDNSIIRDLKKAQVYCFNKDQGCNVKIEFRKLKDHLSVCDFEPVPCVFASRGCQEKILRGKFEEHRKVCPHRPERCSLCRQEVNHGQIQAHKDGECPEAVVGCPFGCPDKKLKRKEIEAHKKTCPVQPVDCKYKAMGCNFTNKREEVERHEKEDMSKHLELLTVKVASIEVTTLDMQGRMQAIVAQRDVLHGNLQSTLDQERTSHTALRRVEDNIKETKLKMVTVLEKVFTLERRVPGLVDQGRVQAAEQSITQLQAKVTELERAQAREQQQQQQSGAPGGAVVGAAGNGRVGRFNDAHDMASEWWEDVGQ
ncbi:hypothetical protein ACOMHN_033134 [Nucella lapillus]